MAPLEEDKLVAAAAEELPTVPGWNVPGWSDPVLSPLSTSGSPVPSWGRSFLRGRLLGRTASTELTELPTQ